MSVSLQKGQKVSLTKDNAQLSRVVVGLGWDEAPRQKKRSVCAEAAGDRLRCVGHHAQRRKICG